MKILKAVAMTAFCLMLGSCYNNSDDDLYTYISTASPDVSLNAVQQEPTPSYSEAVNVKPLIIEQMPEKYSYNDLNNDIISLQKKYGDAITVIKVCETYDKRDVYDIVAGDIGSENHIMIMGAMHAREYITSQLVMRQLCDYLEKDKDYEYKGVRSSELRYDVAVHFIPMVNPDGVTLCQEGTGGLQTEEAKTTVASICQKNNFHDYEQWKANAEGTDINRNFDAGWDEYNSGAQQKAPDHYKGEYPGSSPEAAGLIQLTQNYGFDRTISYHTKGNLIYWYYKQSGEILDKSRAFAQEISDISGYYLDGDYTSVDAAGYKDWAVYRMGIPSVTIEVGGDAANNPVPIKFFTDIWQRNKDVVWAAVYNLKYE